MMAVNACYLLIVPIEFPLSLLSLRGSLLRVTPSPPPPPPPGQPSRAAIPAAPSTAAPSATASTTTTWCVSPATKATPWKDRRRPSARPTASGASSRPHAGVTVCCRGDVRRLGWSERCEMASGSLLLEATTIIKLISRVPLGNQQGLPSCTGMDTVAEQVNVVFKYVLIVIIWG